MATKDPFEEFINSLSLNLSGKGLEAPELEQLVVDVEGDVLKISYDLYLFLDHTKPKYYMLTSNQKMQNIGRMSLKDAVAKFNKLLNKKKS